ncbi:MAG: UDP-N-acetylmuramate:L-alanyl-gamma-D-glutamyl-meso-diaminopimelate ligase [Gammaproteobacteria bacterium]|nr:UDP-N-acetylmuramate:L-alanyl-gamma-D-glutamyl-meso-diaminopimelate ligase [Gammaproteobacteria bacterium]MBV8404163.1 UDP-N-acetylmuramate:L-alanyl-gamma-D-glutamyl-meso-diaminopimelate ligase [Gammaproteobacteria bacterium]
MHVHILGICGTFMGGVAALARAAGFTVTGSDRNVYPPMSTQLEALGIAITEGFDAAQLSPAPDVVVVGNVMTRGQPVVEALLESSLPYVSGPEWLSREVLKDRWVLAVAGTHGKTTTASLLAWILESAGLDPGFLIGGVPANFGVSARLGRGRFFVIEADEYDTAFFDKRAKFVHYRPRTVVLNNLEYDHADIYPDIGAIQRQFHHLIRIVPGSGRIVWNAADAQLRETLALGCWTPCEGFARTLHSEARWSARALPGAADFSRFEVLEGGEPRGAVEWSLIGGHNVDNALAAIAAARHAGVEVPRAVAALKDFGGIARRLQLRGEVNGIRVYDDFAHHPTAIATTIDGLRRRAGAARILAVLEPRSHTMRMGVHEHTLAPALAGADEVWLYTPPDLGWDTGTVLRALGGRGHGSADVDSLARALALAARPGDQVLIMSNGGFGGLHGKLLAQLQQAGRAS